LPNFRQFHGACGEYLLELHGCRKAGRRNSKCCNSNGEDEQPTSQKATSLCFSTRTGCWYASKLCDLPFGFGDTKQFIQTPTHLNFLQCLSF